MGYYTQFTLECECDNDYVDEDEVLAKLKDINPDLYEYCHNENEPDTFESFFWEELKWYNHSTDMVRLSEYFPDVTFILTGEGENRSDSWKGYYRNGNAFHARAKVTYEEPPMEFFK